jgi:hypothetical protein
MVRGPGGRTLKSQLKCPALNTGSLQLWRSHRCQSRRDASLPRCFSQAPRLASIRSRESYSSVPPVASRLLRGIAAMVEGVSSTLPGTCMKSGERTLSHLGKLHPRARSKVPCRSAVSITAAAGSCRHARGPKNWHGRAPLT